MKLHFNRLFPLLVPSLILISGKGVYAQVRGQDKFVRNLGEVIDGEYFFAINDTGADFSLDSNSVPNIVEDMMFELESAEEVKVYNRPIKGFFVSGIDSETAERIAEDDSIAFIEQNQVFILDEDFGFELDIVPDIPKVVNQSPAPWGLDRIDQRDLPLDNTYSVVGDGTGITAYIIDSGIRITHNEFKVAGSDASRASFGINTSADDTENDCNGHGTHVAGILGGLTRGVAKNVELIAVKAFNCERETNTRRLLSAIEFVQEHAETNAKIAITNMSLSGSKSPALNEAVKNLHNSGIVTVVSAGNDRGGGVDACDRSPAGEPAVITVGNTDIDDNRYEESNFGTCVDLFAPGTGISSASFRNNRDFRTTTGTSQSAPHVAGVAALLLEKGVSPVDVKQEIVSMATDDKVIDPGPGSVNKLLFGGESDIIIFEEKFEGESGSFRGRTFQNRVVTNNNCNENACIRLSRRQNAQTRFISVTPFSQVEISFIYSTNVRVDAGEDLILESQYRGESNWTSVNTYPPVDENTQESALVSVTPEGERLRFRFRGTASGGNERYFIDNVVTRGFL